eukprot:49523-Eustigmatos_ZCMA.PRE.1
MRAQGFLFLTLALAVALIGVNANDERKCASVCPWCARERALVCVVDGWANQWGLSVYARRCLYVSACVRATVRVIHLCMH